MVFTNNDSFSSSPVFITLSFSSDFAVDKSERKAKDGAAFIRFQAEGGPCGDSGNRVSSLDTSA